MNAMRGTFKNGQVLLSSPPDWPEGTQLLVEPLPQDATLGIREEDWQDTPEAISQWLRWYEALEPLTFTPEEKADLATWRQKVKEFTIDTMHKSIEGLFP